MPRNVEFRTEAVWYAPDVDGNRKESDPFQVLIAPMSGRDAQALERSLVQNAIVGSTEQDIENRVRAVQEGYILKHVLEVKGYSVTNVDTGIVFVPKTGADLVQAFTIGPASERVIMRDIVQAIERHSKLTEGLVGKSQQQSDSLGQKTMTRGDGAAHDAKGDQKATSSVQSETVTKSPTQTLAGPGTQSFVVAPGPN